MGSVLIFSAGLALGLLVSIALFVWIAVTGGPR